MRKFWQNTSTIQEDNGKLKNQSSKLQQSLVELDCEDTIINEKKEFGRVRNSMMKVLRAKYGNDVANRTLNRINKRIQTSNPN